MELVFIKVVLSEEYMHPVLGHIEFCGSGNTLLKGCAFNIKWLFESTRGTKRPQPSLL